MAGPASYLMDRGTEPDEIKTILETNFKKIYMER